MSMNLKNWLVDCMSKSNEDLKTRNWFITVNKGADCYNKIDSTSLNKMPYIKNWYLVIHKPGHDNEHKHVVITTKNAIRFVSVKEMFSGANIEVSKDLNASVQYLTHKNNVDKEQYDKSSVLTNNPVQFEKLYCESSKELFNADNIVAYYEQGCITFLAFYKRFGSNISKHQSLIKNVLSEINSNTEKSIQYIDRRIETWLTYMERLKQDKSIVLKAQELANLENQKKVIERILNDNENHIE